MDILLIAVPTGEAYRIFLIPSEELEKYDMEALNNKWCGEYLDDTPLSDLWYRLDTDLKKYEDPLKPCSFNKQYLIFRL